MLDEARRPGRFALDHESAHRTRLRALTWANFPGIHGKIYRALVIGTGGHRARGGVVTYAVRPEGRLPTSRARAVRWSAIDRAGADPG